MFKYINYKRPAQALNAILRSPNHDWICLHPISNNNNNKNN